MSIFTQNSKLKQSSTPAVRIIGFALAPIATCPFAGVCKSFCYARKGLYRTHAKNCARRWKSNLRLTQSVGGWLKIAKEIARQEKNATRARAQLAIRLHTEGDFYDRFYVKGWLEIIARFPAVKFYAYTKSHQYFDCASLPANLTLIASEGGTHDSLLADWSGPVARVVDAPTGKPGTIDGSDDDKIALFARPGTVIEIVKH